MWVCPSVRLAADRRSGAVADLTPEQRAREAGEVFLRVQCGKCDRWTNAHIPQAFIEKCARSEVRRALEEAAKADCRWCRGEGPYSKKPKPNKNHGMLMHLANDYPPRSCEAAGVRALAAKYREGE